MFSHLFQITVDSFCCVITIIHILPKGTHALRVQEANYCHLNYYRIMIKMKGMVQKNEVYYARCHSVTTHPKAQHYEHG